MTESDLDDLARLVAASEAVSPAPWSDDGSAIEVFDEDAHLIAEAQQPKDAKAIIALRNAAPALLALAREALAARETYRVEEDDECWCVIAHGRSLEWCRGYVAVEPGSGYTRRIVRERDGEVVT